jgi:CHAT domain-containing protein
MFAGADFAEGHVGLPPGSLLAVFSDGLTETLDEEGRQFRRQRVVETLRAVWSGSAVQILERLLGAVERRAGQLANGAVRASEEGKGPTTPRTIAVPAVPTGDRPFAHPRYWAAFILLGDPD